MDDKNTSEKESNTYAANSIQELVELQFHSLSWGDYQRKLFKASIRHNCAELCELSGEYTVFREFAIKREYELPRSDADKGYNKEDTGDEDKELHNIF